MFFSVIQVLFSSSTWSKWKKHGIFRWWSHPNFFHAQPLHDRSQADALLQLSDDLLALNAWTDAPYYFYRRATEGVRPPKPPYRGVRSGTLLEDLTSKKILATMVITGGFIIWNADFTNGNGDYINMITSRNLSQKHTRNIRYTTTKAGCWGWPKTSVFSWLIPP